MSKNTEKHQQVKSLLKAKQEIITPFSLNHDGIEYNCINVLRLLPEKRVVVEAISAAKQHCVIKLFAAGHKGQRELEREQQGHALARAAGVKVADILFSSDDLARCFAIAYQFIDNAQEINLKNTAKNQGYVVKILELLAKMHNYGIYQADIHLDNILLADDEIYLIDLASVKREHAIDSVSKSTSLANLALMVAQFSLFEQDIFMAQIVVYYDLRGWKYNHQEQLNFAQQVQKMWQWRKQNYLNKCFRNCTMTTYKRSSTQEYAFRADFLRNSPADFIDNIEGLMAQGKLLKAGNSATVVQVKLNGRQLVIKRYNIKGFSHFSKRCWRKSRAAISWQNANLLDFVGIATPTPLGFIEKRWFGLRYTAYFISEYLPANELLAEYQHRAPTEYELAQIKQLFMAMDKNKIAHGDLKASNLLLDEQGKVLMIDLDSMQEYRCSGAFQQAFNKDKFRFLQNWQNPKTQKLFSDLLP